jgi:hypothetical protein
MLDRLPALPLQQLDAEVLLLHDCRGIERS